MNSVPAFTGTATLRNSPILISSSPIGIVTTSPAQALDVDGSVQVEGSPIILGGLNTISSTTQGPTGTVLQSKSSYLAVGCSVSESLGYNFGVTNYHDSGILGYVCAGGVGPTSNYMGLSFYAAPSGLIVNGLGSVGIGTTSPGAKLEVDGNVKLTAGCGASVTCQDGNVQSVAWNGVLGGGYYAESVDVIDSRAQYESGDVLVIDSMRKANS